MLDNKSRTRRKAAEDYVAGKTSISKAAEKAGATVWEMEQYLVSKGFKSQYSTEDLKDEMNKIKAK
jgi:predicted HTH domain antitoxin